MASTMTVGSPSYRLGRTKTSRQEAGRPHRGTRPPAQPEAGHRVGRRATGPAARRFDPHPGDTGPERAQRSDEILRHFLVGGPPDRAHHDLISGQAQGQPGPGPGLRIPPVRDRVLSRSGTATPMARTQCGGARPRRIASAATAVPVHSTMSVIRPRPAFDRHVGAPAGGRLELVEREAVIGCTMRGTPARRAASRPTAPAFAPWVCTTSKARVRNSDVRRPSAWRSWTGSRSAHSEGSRIAGTPARSAAASR